MTGSRLKITDTTFRDAHQSLMATRLRTEEMEPIAEMMDSSGFHSLEVWGGATFDVTTRFLAEDPWDRLRTFKRLMPKTPLQMLLRGQSLVGYRNYADDVVKAFIDRSSEAGIDVYRVFDALNDERNLETAANAIKKVGKHLQMTICYSTTEEGRMGGPIYDLEYFIKRAQVFQTMGADSICIKDMAGLLAPYDAYDLIHKLKSILELPIQLHTHYTSGMASMTVLKAIEAGVDVIDTCLAPLALRTSQPAIEPLLVSLNGSERDPQLQLAPMLEMGDHLESVLIKYKNLISSTKTSVIDARVLSHQIPGGMASNLASQLREAEALDKLPEVLAEIPITRAELGFPPLVTPISQMVGSQAVSNVLFGKYSMISGPIKDYIFGLYGRPPAPVQASVVEKALDGYKRGQEPFTGRPADLLEPEMPDARKAIKDISADPDDVLTYALYPTTGMKFLRIKHGLDPAPDKIKLHDEVSKPTRDTTVSSPFKGTDFPKSAHARAFNVYLGEEVYQVEVDPIHIDPDRPKSGTKNTESVTPTFSKHKPSFSFGLDSGDVGIESPMPGLLLKHAVIVGQDIRAGDPVVVLEAMKMENSLPAPIDGRVKSLPIAEGSSVVKGSMLAVISPLGNTTEK